MGHKITSMKKIRIVYWVSTSLMALLMLFSGFSYFTNPQVAQGFQHIGFPSYFRVELGTAKLIGAVLLLLPLSPRLKEWTYAGFTFTFLSASIAHGVLGDPMPTPIMPLVFLGVLAISYFSYHKLQAGALVNDRRAVQPQANLA